MQKSLKKQIFQNKISNFLKTHSIILFFAIVDLPQKKNFVQGKPLTQKELKPLINIILNNTKQKSSTIVQRNSFQRRKASGNFSSEKMPSHVSLCYSPLMDKNIKGIETLHISNKCFQNLYKNNKLPLYGQTLAIAIRQEEDLVFFSTFFSLYKSILLGGFYKNKPQTKSYFTSLCNKVQEKGQVHGGLLNVLSVTHRNLQKTVNAPAINCLRLLNYIAKR